MNNIKTVFDHGKAFIPFVTAGDPDLKTTERLLVAMAQAGADLIEIGLPFSDPIAEGAVIQEADQRALSAGTTTDKIFEMIGSVRQQCAVPLAIMTYVNPVFVYGADLFLKTCAALGVCALIVPDLPFEEREELEPYCTAHDVKLITLVAPTSEDRIQTIATQVEGFLYCVSSLGVTGTRESIGDDVKYMIEKVRSVSDIPCAVGFGISTPEQAKELSVFSDGVIVGSAIVKIVAQYGAGSIEPVAEYVRMMKQAIQ